MHLGNHWTWGLAHPLQDQQEEGAVTIEESERISKRASASRDGQHAPAQGGVFPALGPELGGSSGVPGRQMFWHPVATGFAVTSDCRASALRSA